jgi:hypothetical protein
MSPEFPATPLTLPLKGRESPEAAMTAAHRVLRNPAPALHPRAHHRQQAGDLLVQVKQLGHALGVAVEALLARDLVIYQTTACLLS